METLRKWMRNSEGFSLIELVVIIGLVGILCAIAIQSFIAPRSKLKIEVTEALATVRDLQTVSHSYMFENGIPPDTVQLNDLYKGTGSNTILGKFNIIRANDVGGAFTTTIDGVTPEYYVICSIMPIEGVNYVYAFDNKRPKAVPIGEDPLGVPICGAGAANLAANNSGTSGSSNNNTNDNGNGSNNNNNNTNPSNPTLDDLKNICGVDDKCPCSNNWRSQSQYLNCVKNAVQECLDAGKVTMDQLKAIQNSANLTDCGGHSYNGCGCGW